MARVIATYRDSLSFTLYAAGGIKLGGVSTSSVAPLNSQGVDTLWLADNAAVYGGPPYVLGQAFSNGGRSYTASQAYTLQADVTTPYSAFIIAPTISGGAYNLSLNLNGHTVTYCNQPMPGVANGMFDQDTPGTSPQIPTGWTLLGGRQTSISVRPVSEGPLRFPTGQNRYGAQALKLTLPGPVTGCSIAIGPSNVARVTKAGHGLVSGDYIVVNGPSGGFSWSPEIRGIIWKVSVLDANTFDLVGSSMTSASGTLYFIHLTVLESSDITIPAAPHAYAVTCQTVDPNPGAANVHTINLRVLQNIGGVWTDLPRQDGSTSGADFTSFPTSTYAGNNFRPFAASEAVQPLTTDPIRVRVLIGNTSGTTTDVWLGRVRFTTAWDHGVILPMRGKNPGMWLSMSSTLRAIIQNAGGAIYNKSTTITIEDTPSGRATPTVGSIQMGPGRGWRSHGIYGDVMNPNPGYLRVRDITIGLRGDDSLAIVGTIAPPGAGQAIFGGDPDRGVTIVHSEMPNVLSRDLTLGTIHFGITSLSPTTYNEISYSTVVATMGSSLKPQGGPWKVHDNRIFPQAAVTNSYVFDNGEIYNNFVDAVSDTVDSPGSPAHGMSRPYGSCHGVVIARSTGNSTNTGVYVHDNTFIIQDRSDRETQAGNSGRVFRIRNQEDLWCGGLVDMQVYNNDVTMVTDAGFNYAEGARVSILPPTNGNYKIFIGDGATHGGVLWPTGAAICSDTSGNNIGHQLNTGDQVYMVGGSMTPSLIGAHNYGGPYTITKLSNTVFSLDGQTLTSISNNQCSYAPKARYEAMLVPDNIQFRNNTFRGVTLNAANTATGFILDGKGDDIAITFEGNTFVSNQYSLGIVGPDSTRVCDAVFHDSTFVEDVTYPGAITTTHYAVHLGMAGLSRTALRNQIVGASFSGGASQNFIVDTGGSGQREFTWGWNVAATVTDQGTGLPISGATVTVLNGSSATDSTGTTDAAGRVTGLKALVTNINANPSVVTTTLGPHTLRVSASGYTTANINLGTVSGDVDQPVSLS